MGDNDTPVDGAPPLGPLASRACDNCRNRKIRCDRASPCSNCRASNSTCQTTPRIKENRQRVLISHQYERKIQTIDERLLGIERLLKNLAVSIPSSHETHASVNGPEDTSRFPPRGVPLSIDNTDRKTAATTPEFEGESSFSAHSVLASQLFEKTMGDSPHFEHNPEIMEALSSLRDIMKRQHLTSSVNALQFPGQKMRKVINTAHLKLPPSGVVHSLLQHGKENPPLMFLTLTVMDMEYFTRICKDLYFCVEECSQSHFAIVNCVLSYLFLEYGPSKSADPAMANYAKYSSLCRTNFETVISAFNHCMEPSYENVLALALGAFHATECSKVSLCWNFICAAARMCQNLGYHRRVAQKGDSEADIKRKTNVFWFIYLMDKGLSVCFGRTSTLQDYDIALEYPQVDGTPETRPWLLLHRAWIVCARLSGEIYEHLYSARAQFGDTETRVKKAYRIAREAQDWRDGIAQIKNCETLNPFLRLLVIPGADFSYYLLLTLVYRVIPPSQPPETPSGLSLKCIDAARMAMQVHQQITIAFKDGDVELWKGFINWTLLQFPFAPFMVVFCHTITASSLDDLKLLEDASNSLQAAGRVSEGADRLYRLCVVFYQVAKVYVDAQLKELEHTSANLPYPGTEFDSFFTALGFAPPQAPPPSRGNGTTNTGEEEGMGNTQLPGEFEMEQTLDGWFTGSQYIMGLLESDM